MLYLVNTQISDSLRLRLRTDIPNIHPQPQ